jgi:hypothetical protein
LIFFAVFVSCQNGPIYLSPQTAVTLFPVLPRLVSWPILFLFLPIAPGRPHSLLLQPEKYRCNRTFRRLKL